MKKEELNIQPQRSLKETSKFICYYEFIGHKTIWSRKKLKPLYEDNNRLRFASKLLACMLVHMNKYRLAITVIPEYTDKTDDYCVHFNINFELTRYLSEEILEEIECQFLEMANAYGLVVKKY